MPTRKTAAVLRSHASALGRDLLDLINAVRAKQDLVPLALERHLNSAAKLHSAWINDMLVHGTPDGRTPLNRIEDANWYVPNWAEDRIGETLAVQPDNDDGSFQGELQGTVETWMTNPDDRANILHADIAQNRTDLI